MVAQECWSIRIVWHQDVVPKEWREGLINKEEPGNDGVLRY